jgi:hypothetical protein
MPTILCFEILRNITTNVTADTAKAKKSLAAIEAHTPGIP